MRRTGSSQQYLFYCARRASSLSWKFTETSWEICDLPSGVVFPSSWFITLAIRSQSRTNVLRVLSRFSSMCHFFVQPEDPIVRFRQVSSVQTFCKQNKISYKIVDSFLWWLSKYWGFEFTLFRPPLLIQWPKNVQEIFRLREQFF